jgi:hypothetical protein
LKILRGTDHLIDPQENGDETRAKTETTANHDDDTTEALHAVDRETDQERDDDAREAVTAAAQSHEIVNDSDAAEVEAETAIAAMAIRVQIERKRRKSLLKSKCKS